MYKEACHSERCEALKGELYINVDSVSTLAAFETAAQIYHLIPEDNSVNLSVNLFLLVHVFNHSSAAQTPLCSL